ncbi:MAG: PD40 domain-containing protein, partial [Deltaproteobacteria bacterium]|nr:PD40 domain-containing protein [Deltaproteobacteria bacterium]
MPNCAIAPDGESVFVELRGRIHRLGMDDGSDDLVPFEADVSLDVEPRLEFPRRVETGPVRARRAQHLSVAADGRVAFSTLARIWVADPDSEAPRRLTDTERSREFLPAWSADGRWIAFVTWDDTGGHLWKARSDGSGNPVRLSTTSALWVDPAWTPDGSGVVAITAPLGSTLAARGPVPADAQVVVIPADGGAARDVLPANGFRHPHFTDGSDRVYLSSPQAGLVSVALDGSDRRVEARLTREAGAGELRMSPDGRFLLGLFAQTVLRFSVPASGLAGAELSLDQAVTVTDDAPTSVAWSADGTSVSWLVGMVLSRVEATGDAVGQQEVSLRVEVPRPVPSGDVVLRGAKIVTMRGYEIIDDGDVVVRDNRIVAVGPRNTVPVPAGARVVDVTGKVIVPGFIDIHAHLGTAQELLRPESISSFANLAYGITTVRDPQTNPDVFAVADIIEADAVPGPRMFSTGPGLFSTTDFQSLDEVRRTLQTYRDEYGTHLIKEYLVGTRQQRQWVVQAAREMNMMVTNEGGADTKGDLTHAMDGFSGNEHNFPVAPIYNDLIQLYARTGITYTPTLIVSFGGALPIYRLLAEERPHENAKISRWFGDGALYARTSSRLLWFPPEDHNNIEVAQGVNAVLQAGGRVGLGGHGELQGLSNHWEMKLLARG